MKLVKELIQAAIFCVLLMVIFFIVMCFVDPSPRWLTNKELEQKIVSSFVCSIQTQLGDGEKVSANISLRSTRGIIVGANNISEKILGISNIPFEGTMVVENEKKSMVLYFKGNESLCSGQVFSDTSIGFFKLCSFS